MQTLNTFFGTQIDSSEWAGSVAQTEGFSQTKQALNVEFTDFNIPQSLYERLVKKLCEGLDIEINKILVEGYRKHQEIVQYREKENPPTGFHEVTLLEHTLESKHSPKIELIRNQETLFTLDFEVALELKLDGGKLFIRDGTIVKAETGTCIGSGTVSFEGFPILEKETAPYTLPGKIDFDPAIEI
jgi:hypothetical protein